MKKILICALFPLALSLAACQTISPDTAPAPLARTTIDEKVLVTLLQSADAVATGVDKLVAAKVIVPATPRAHAIQSALKDIRTAIQAVSAAQRAGNTTDYATALTQASAAFTRAAELLRQIQGS